MKIVIEIPEDEYRWIKQSDNTAAAALCSKECMMNAIKNGTPLPKGHGRLIDADRLKIDNPLHLSLDIPYVTEDTVEGIIDHAPTIIEADEEREDEV